ncbi:LapA family protein [Paracoccus rhizosphaerae]|uniref:Lipopolysaccharide assembly LapA domain-containing protein n=1 Tax=Paracoccus rhizosphaerae TaxID=1133347 RepID=A0ABV6CPF4_9RHOB|nr:LapA family protein [Paracoccus rhizosphaerae]
MRFIRLIFIALLALILVGVALANREMVTLSLFPAGFGQFLGGTWSLAVPLFVVIFGAFALGMLAGLLWEWMREANYRREARLRHDEVARLESEMGHLRERHAAPRDDVLAILDEPSNRRPAAARVPSHAGTTPAQLPAAR